MRQVRILYDGGMMCLAQVVEADTGGTVPSVVAVEFKWFAEKGPAYARLTLEDGPRHESRYEVVEVVGLGPA